MSSGDNQFYQTAKGGLSMRMNNAEQLAEGKRRQLQIPVMDKLKVDKILKKARAKMGKDYDYGVGKGATFILDMDEKLLNKVLDIMVSNRIRVKGL